MPRKKLLPRYTWDEYRQWDDDTRWELVDGEPFAMAPAPTPVHQSVVTCIGAAFRDFLRGKPCRAFVSPIDVRLSESDVVQPDVVVVCDSNQIRHTHIEGAPTLVVEVQSPESVRHDRIRKLRLYAQAGVKEYWLITPYPAMVEVLLLATDGSYHARAAFTEKDTLESPTFPDLRLPLADIFDFPIPPEVKVNEIRESTPPYGAKRPRHGAPGRG
ncbi:MAG: hypothetical protein A3K19_24545 [Lentisphaerae bacterium RIFOXYB12_FULL_65_16]|nr:MAG: hypothetical protein A3K18_17410 [Lentisphaerae bacterium RIFOXYA12_64_32]OGV83980.1 MAG: hypothetical protein A3K19_24545 [Lentisphaerae bacterium RIFOXYB12_FULL_65_16]